MADPVGAYGVEAPTSSDGTAQKSVFSRPLFKFLESPCSLLAMNRHNLLLEVKAKSRVFKCLLEGYPGEHKIWNLHVGASPKEEESSTHPRNPPLGEKVRHAPGLSSIVQDPPRREGLDRPSIVPRGDKPIHCTLLSFKDHSSLYSESPSNQ